MLHLSFVCNYASLLDLFPMLKMILLFTIVRFVDTRKDVSRCFPVASDVRYYYDTADSYEFVQSHTSFQISFVRKSAAV